MELPKQERPENSEGRSSQSLVINPAHVDSFIQLRNQDPSVILSQARCCQVLPGRTVWWKPRTYSLDKSNIGDSRGQFTSCSGFDLFEKDLMFQNPVATVKER